MIMGHDAELTGKLVTLEQEVNSKSSEIAQLKEQVSPFLIQFNSILTCTFIASWSEM